MNMRRLAGFEKGEVLFSSDPNSPCNKYHRNPDLYDFLCGLSAPDLIFEIVLKEDWRDLMVGFGFKTADSNRITEILSSFGKPLSLLFKTFACLGSEAVVPDVNLWMGFLTTVDRSEETKILTPVANLLLRTAFPDGKRKVRFLLGTSLYSDDPYHYMT